MIQLTQKQQRRRDNGKSFRKLRSLWARIKNRKPARDEDYLQWLRMQPCAVPDCTSARRKWSSWQDCMSDVVEAAHVGAIRGLRQKCSDREAIPICAYHHRTGPHSHHVLGKEFWLFWQLDREKTIAKYNALYEERDA